MGMRLTLVGLSIFLAWMSDGYAQTLPGPADAGRITPNVEPITPPATDEVEIPTISPAIEIPEAAKTIRFTLKDVHIEGTTIFTREELSDVYAPYQNKEVTLEIAWMMAGTITERYRSAGYFLSRAYVPEQRIKDGVISIHVVEGYIGRVESDSPEAERPIIRKLIARLEKQKPVTVAEVESFLLRLNDLPGLSVRGVLSPLNEEADGAVKLTLVAAKAEMRGSLSFDNYGSRFLGPHQASASYSASLLPLQQTTASVLSSLPVDELHYAALNHLIAATPDITVEWFGSTTRARPGHTLEELDIDSRSLSTNVEMTYQWIRQRQENLAINVIIDGRDTRSNLMNTPFIRDHIRVLRAGLAYEVSKWNGANAARLLLSQGLKILGASDKGDRNLSRAEALPDFTKAEFSFSRLQNIVGSWSLMASLSGQVASGPLYSAEEFGYGGQTYGRAYDASEITGDHGVSGMLEIRYDGLGEWKSMQPTPYIFYDYGKIWNDDTGQQESESGSSVGLGIRMNGLWTMAGNMALAFPLTRDVSTPIYGDDEKSPRILFQISKQF